MEAKVHGAHESHDVALQWATAFLGLSGLSKTQFQTRGDSSFLWPLAGSRGFSQEVLERTELPEFLPPGTRVL